jgi:sporulation protein YlmC with PRC-barrel domain
MALTPFAELDDFQLVDSDQDCRGWPVLDATGQQVGTVREMLVDTDGERVAALVLDSGAQVPAGAVSFNDGRVLLGQSERAR